MDQIIRAVAFRQGDVWVIQGVDYDIVAQTKDPLDAPGAFLRAVIATAAVNAEHGRMGLDSIQAAPARFREMFQQARKAVRDLNAPPALDQMPPPQVDLRVYHQAA